MASSGNAITVALVNDYEVVVRGLDGMFADHADRVNVIELDVSAPVAQHVDVALYDTFSQPQGHSPEVIRVLADPAVEKVVVYSWNLKAEAIASALEKGVDGYLSKAMSAEELVAALERVHAGERVVCEPVRAGVESPIAGGDWPGRTEGLTAREAEIIALITQGLTNKEIADRTLLSINSIKTYIRSAYRRMGVERRSQAVLWGVRHGFEQDAPERVVVESS